MGWQSKVIACQYDCVCVLLGLPFCPPIHVDTESASQARQPWKETKSKLLEHHMLFCSPQSPTAIKVRLQLHRPPNSSRPASGVTCTPMQLGALIKRQAIAPKWPHAAWTYMGRWPIHAMVEQVDRVYIYRGRPLLLLMKSIAGQMVRSRVVKASIGVMVVCVVEYIRTWKCPRAGKTEPHFLIINRTPCMWHQFKDNVSLTILGNAGGTGQRVELRPCRLELQNKRPKGGLKRRKWKWGDCNPWWVTEECGYLIHMTCIARYLQSIQAYPFINHIPWWSVGTWGDH